MNSLAYYGIDLDATPREMERSIARSIPKSSISKIRSDLFLESKEYGLTTAGDALVTRRKTNGGKTMMEKHIADIYLLVSSIKNRTAIPRTLLRNGKRSKEELTTSQNRHQNVAHFTEPVQSSETSNLMNTTPDPQGILPDLESTVATDTFRADNAAENAFHSTVVSNINSLRSSVDNLKEEVQMLK